MSNLKTVKLVGALALTLITPLAMGALAFLTFQTDAAGHRLRAIQMLVDRSARVWDPMVGLYRHGVPDPAMSIPKGDVRPVLEAMMARKLVKRAFYASPDRRLVLAERVLRGPRPYHRVVDMTEVDLAHWQPDPPADSATNRVLLRDRDANIAYWRHRNQVQFLNHLRAVIMGRWHLSKPSFIYLPGFYDSPYLAFKEDDRQALIGYELDTWALKEAGDGLLKQRELDQQFSWSLGSMQGWRSIELPPRSNVPPEIGYLRLIVDDLAIQTLLPEIDLQFWLGLMGLSVLFVLSVSGMVRGLRVLFAEQSLAVAQSDFVSSVSHEMRTPLTTIKMYAELMEQGIVVDAAKRADYLRTIRQECDRLTRLIENVLDYAATSRGRKTYHFEPLRFKDLVDETLETLSAPLQAAGLKVEVSVPENLVVRADRDAMRRALINLMSNAVKYASEGRRIVIRGEDRGSSVRVTVQDFGPGIPPDEQRRIFQPFYRIGSELTRRSVGSGLGLALVKASLQAHGGKIEVESAPGKGAAFHLTWPKEPKAV
jgi:signal transduction histidine kinase